MKSLPKPVWLTLRGVSKVSLVLAPLRVLSPRLVGTGVTCASEDDSKAMQTTNTVRQKLRRGNSLDVAGNDALKIEC